MKFCELYVYTYISSHAVQQISGIAHRAQYTRLQILLPSVALFVSVRVT